MRSTCLALALVVPLCTACESDFTTVAQEVSTEAQVLGPARGEANAYIFFFSPTYNILFIGWGGRAQSACDTALGCVPGGTALRDVTLQESWFWFVVGTRRTLTVTGNAVVDR